MEEPDSPNPPPESPHQQDDPRLSGDELEEPLTPLSAAPPHETEPEPTNEKRAEPADETEAKVGQPVEPDEPASPTAEDATAPAQEAADRGKEEEEREREEHAEESGPSEAHKDEDSAGKKTDDSQKVESSGKRAPAKKKHKEEKKEEVDAHLKVNMGSKRAQDGDGRRAKAPPAADSGESVFPPNFDWQSHEDVHRLAEDNSRLSREVKHGKAEIAKLEAALLTLQEELQVTDGADSPEKLARELAQKNRSLNVALGRERARVAKLTEDLEKARADIATLMTPSGGSLAREFGKTLPRLESVGVAGAEAAAPAPAEDVKQLKEKMARLRSRLSDTQTEVTNTRAEVVKLQRALQREIGEEVPLERVFDEAGKWKGRAEEIHILRDRVRELSRQVAAASGGGAAGGAVAGAGASATPVMERPKKHIEEMQRERREEEARQARALAQAEEDLVRVRAKAQAASLRVTTAEQSLKEARNQMRLLLEKSDNDDRLIDALRGELQRAKQQRAAAAAPAAPGQAASGQTGEGGHRAGAGAGARAGATTVEAINSASRAEESAREIQALQRELREARRMNLQALRGAMSEWDRHERDERIALLHEENERRRDLVTTLEGRLDDSRKKEADLGRRVAELESRAAALEIRARGTSRGSLNGGGGPSRGSSSNDLVSDAAAVPSVASMSKLQARLAVTQERLQAVEGEKVFLAQQYQDAVQQREEQIRGLEDMVRHTKLIHQKAVNGLRQQFLQLQSRVEGHSASGTTDRDAPPQQASQDPPPVFTGRAMSPTGSVSASPRPFSPKNASPSSGRVDSNSLPPLR